APGLDVAVNVRDFGAQQAVGARPDLVRRAVVDAQRARASSYVNAEGQPGEGLLEDALAEVAGEEEAVATPGAESCQEAQLGDAEVLRLVHDCVVEGRWRSCRI